jgi:L-lactate utilization protein LutC
VEGGEIMDKWTTIPSQTLIEKTIEALKKNGIDASLVETGIEAKQKALDMIPEGSEVMEASSTTLEELGLIEHIQEYGKYDSVKKKLNSLSRDTHHLEMQKIGAAPEYVIGSVHAVTEDGRVIVASRSGSQMPAYSYGSSHVIWIVGAQKIVKDLDEGLKRIYEFILPLESKRVQKAYGMEKSEVAKLLIFNKEVKEGRIHLIFVKEVLGF